MLFRRYLWFWNLAVMSCPHSCWDSSVEDRAELQELVGSKGCWGRQCRGEEASRRDCQRGLKLRELSYGAKRTCHGIASGDVSIQSVQHGTHGWNAWHNCKRLTVEHCWTWWTSKIQHKKAIPACDSAMRFILRQHNWLNWKPLWQLPLQMWSLSRTMSFWGSFISPMLSLD